MANGRKVNVIKSIWRYSNDTVEQCNQRQHKLIASNSQLFTFALCRRQNINEEKKKVGNKTTHGRTTPAYSLRFSQHVLKRKKWKHQGELHNIVINSDN